MRDKEIEELQAEVQAKNEQIAAMIMKKEKEIQQQQRSIQLLEASQFQVWKVYIILCIYHICHIHITLLGLEWSGEL